MDIFQSSQDLIKKIADMVIAEVLCLQELVEICLHEVLYYISVLQVKVKHPTVGDT